MADLAATANGFVVPVQTHVRRLEQFISGCSPEQIDHACELARVGGAGTGVGNSADVVGELRCHARVLRPVTAVVYPGSELVDA